MDEELENTYDKIRIKKMELQIKIKNWELSTKNFDPNDFP